MNTVSSADRDQEARKMAAEAVCSILERFEWIVEILDRLSRGEQPSIGDDDLRHGCQRALTSMLAGLSRITPAPQGKACKMEKTVRRILRTKGADKWLDRDQFERLQQLVDRVLVR